MVLQLMSTGIQLGDTENIRAGVVNFILSRQYKQFSIYNAIIWTYGEGNEEDERNNSDSS
jgi:hypothetical protein